MDSEKSPRNKKMRYVVCIVFCAVLLCVSNFICGFVRVDGQSMEDSYLDKDFVFVWKLDYKCSRGDAVLLQKGNNSNIIKRIIAVGGDMVWMENNQLYINNQEYDEPYVDKSKNWCKEKVEFVVPQGKIYVMGDNRNASTDSRKYGFLDVSEVRGKIVSKISIF